MGWYDGEQNRSALHRLGMIVIEKVDSLITSHFASPPELRQGRSSKWSCQLANVTITCCY